jgi:hypothetical protein
MGIWHRITPSAATQENYKTPANLFREAKSGDYREHFMEDQNRIDAFN